VVCKKEDNSYSLTFRTNANLLGEKRRKRGGGALWSKTSMLLHYPGSGGRKKSLETVLLALTLKKGGEGFTKGGGKEREGVPSS